jgi:ApaG protein
METLITRGIQVTAEAFFESGHSEPEDDRYLFSYQISISNFSTNTVQLLRRHWIIFDSLEGVHEVEGEGVVGLQPILEPGQTHTYSSWCPLQSEIGKMTGSYIMNDIITGETFTVLIPGFLLMTTWKMN